MAPRITWNSNNIDLTIGSDGLQVVFGAQANQNRSGSGKIETLLMYNFGEAILFDAYFQEAVKNSLIAFWAWAEQGNVFSFAKDSAEVSSTTLDGAAAAAQKVVPVTATTGLAAGDVCLIRSADRSKYEVLTVDTVSSGVSITATTNLLYTYASGDMFRHMDYWPSLVMPAGEKFNPSQDGGWYRMQFKFLENL